MAIETEIREWFKKCRRERGLSRSALAERIGVGLSSIERFENGRGMMRLSEIEKGFNEMGYDTVFSLRIKELLNNK